MSDQAPQAAANTPTSGGEQTAAPASTPAPATAPGVLLSEATSQQEPEGQTADGTKPAEGAAEGDGTKTDDKPAGAPEKYEFKAPENKAFDPDVISAYSEVAKELNLPQESAQKVLDVLAPKIAERYEARMLEAVQQQATTWREATTGDKEIGGAKLSENLAVAMKALDAFGSPELRKLLGAYDAKTNPTGTGLGNHPELIRAFFKAGRAISEDKFVPGGKAPQQESRSAARALYPTQT